MIGPVLGVGRAAPDFDFTKVPLDLSVHHVSKVPLAIIRRGGILTSCFPGRTRTEKVSCLTHARSPFISLARTGARIVDVIWRRFIRKVLVRLYLGITCGLPLLVVPQVFRGLSRLGAILQERRLKALA